MIADDDAEMNKSYQKGDQLFLVFEDAFKKKEKPDRFRFP